MVTYDPNELVAQMHSNAIITVLAPADHERWLRGSYEDMVPLEQPYPAGRMTARGPIFPTRLDGNRELLRTGHPWRSKKNSTHSNARIVRRIQMMNASLTNSKLMGGTVGGA
jgi:hypothetical protein